MLKKTDYIGYIGVNNSARLAKKAYIGVNGVAHKVRKMYIGDANGKARLIYQAIPLSIEFKEGTINSIRYRTCFMGTARAGNLAVFAGGKGISVSGSSYSVINNANSEVIGFSKNMTQVLASSSLGYQRNLGGGVSIGNSAFFAGGWDPDSVQSSVCKYDSTLTRTSITDAYNAGLLGTTKAGGYGIFGGGWHTSFWQNYDMTSVCAYNESGTKTNCTALSKATRHLTKDAYVNNYGLLIDSYNSTYYAYNSSLTQVIANSSFPVKSSDGYKGSATASNETFSLFYSNSTQLVLINSSLTMTTINSNAYKIDCPQMSYLGVSTEKTPNGCFLIYGMKPGTATPEYLLYDAVTGALIENKTENPSSMNNPDVREECHGVSIDDIVVLWNPYLGKPVYFKPTSN